MSGPRSVAEILAAWKLGGPDPALVTELARHITARLDRLEHAVEALAGVWPMMDELRTDQVEKLACLRNGEWAEFERLVQEERS